MSSAPRSLARASLMAVLLAAAGALAQAAPPGGHEDVAFDFMNVLSARGLHDHRRRALERVRPGHLHLELEAPLPAPRTPT